MTVKTLEEARKRIKELEKEVAALKAENEELRARNIGGRRKHDEKWTAAYNDFIAKYEGGKSLMEIVAEGEISRRTAYRYLEYYRNLEKDAALDTAKYIETRGERAGREKYMAVLKKAPHVEPRDDDKM